MTAVQRKLCQEALMVVQLVGELRGALAAAAEKVDELEERERATAAAHKKMVIDCYQVNFCIHHFFC